jgi:hypothetical protein
MRFFSTFILSAILLTGFQYFHSPWYLEGFVPMVSVLLFFPRSGGAFFAGFLSFVLVWGMHLNLLLDAQSDLPQRIAELTGLNDVRLLIGLTLGLAGLWGGLSGLVGWAFRKLFVTRKRRY